MNRRKIYNSRRGRPREKKPPKGVIAGKLQEIFGDRPYSEIAEILAVTGPTARNYLTGRTRPPARVLSLVAAWANVSVGILLGQDESNDATAFHIPTYRTGGGLHWVVAEDVQPFDTAIPRTLHAFKVSGDSMEPLARHDQIVLALRDVTAGDGDLALVELRDGTSTFKRIYRKDDTTILASVNPAHDPELVKSATIRHAWKVWGVKF